MMPSAVLIAREKLGLMGLMLVASACATDHAVAPDASGTGGDAAQVAVQGGNAGLVIFQTGENTRGVAAAVRQLGGTVRAELPQVGYVLAGGMDGTRITSLSSRSDVSGWYRDPVMRLIPATRGSSPRRASGVRARGTDQSTAFFFPYQWNMVITQSNAAWTQSKGGAGSVVWVLDTGVDPWQDDLNGKVQCATTGITFARFPSDATAYDFNFHGTFVSAIVSSNGAGVASVAPDAALCSRKVLSEDGSGSFGDMAASIVYAVEHGARIINLSLGAYLDRSVDGVPALIGFLQRVVDWATRRGVLIVVAAGNDGLNLDEDPLRYASIPAELNGVLSVGATGPDLAANYDALASYSNSGGRAGIDLVAPGGDLPDPNNIFDLIISACSQFVCGGTNWYVLAAGTSFAAPTVAGAAAVVQAEMGGAPSPAAVIACLKTTADNVGLARIFGSGRLNTLSAAGCANATARAR